MLRRWSGLGSYRETCMMLSPWSWDATCLLTYYPSQDLPSPSRVCCLFILISEMLFCLLAQRSHLHSPSWMSFECSHCTPERLNFSITVLPSRFHRLKKVFRSPGFAYKVVADEIETAVAFVFIDWLSRKRGWITTPLVISYVNSSSFLSSVSQVVNGLFFLFFSD